MKKILERLKNADLGGALFVAVVVASALTGVEAWAAEPKPVGNEEAASLLTQCMLEPESTEASTAEGAYACCSKTLGYCVKCPADTSQACTLHPSPQSGKHPFLVEIIDPRVLAPESPPTDQTGPYGNSMGVLKNWLERNRVADEEKKKYGSN